MGVLEGADEAEGRRKSFGSERRSLPWWRRVYGGDGEGRGEGESERRGGVGNEEVGSAG